MRVCMLTYKHTYIYTYTHAHADAHTRTVLEVLHFFKSMELTADSVGIFYYWLAVQTVGISIYKHEGLTLKKKSLSKIISIGLCMFLIR